MTFRLYFASSCAVTAATFSFSVTFWLLRWILSKVISWLWEMLLFLTHSFHSPSFILSTGIDEETSAYLLSIIGITNTVGRIVCGWLSDRPWVNALFINNIALVIGGGFTLLSPIVCNDFTL